MIGRLRLVGAVAVCLAMVGVAPVTAQQVAVEKDMRVSSPLAVVGTPGQEAAAAPSNPYTPPACVPGVPFSDITCTTGFDPWIEQFGADGITAGCGGGNYCPSSPVTRDQMAVFIEKAMHGTSAWSPGDLGNGNTGLGAGSLYSNTLGAGNAGLGAGSLYANTTGWYNVGVGPQSLSDNTRAGSNVAVGAYALSTQSYDPGIPWDSDNTAVGTSALLNNQPTSSSNGVWNTAVGAGSLDHNTTGFDNTAIGVKAGARGGDTVIGYTGSTVAFVHTMTGSNNTFVGIAGSTAEVSNCTAVGMDAYCDAGNEVRLGNFYVTSISGKVNFSALSDARAKSDIRDLDPGLDFVMGLRPVSYRLKGGNGRTDMGFVAQDIEALLGDGYSVLGIGGDADRTLSLRYTDFIAPIVKAIQEQQAQITDQAKTIQAQQAQIEALKTAVAERDSALERRLAALERRKP